MTQKCDHTIAASSFLISDNQTACFSPEFDEAFRIIDEHGYQKVESGFPGDIVCQRLMG